MMIAAYALLFRVALGLEALAVRIRDFAQHRKMRAVQGAHGGIQERKGW